jgi:predicted ATPase
LLLATKGYAAPEVEQAFQRAWFLCQQVGDRTQRFQILWGLERFLMVKPNLVQGLASAQQLLTLAQEATDDDLRLEAYCALGTQLFHQVELLETRRYLEQSLAIYDQARHLHHALLYGQDPGVVALSYLAWTLWCLGYPEQALARNQAALALAQERAHPYSQVIAQVYAMIQAHFLQDITSCRAQAEALIALTEQYEFTLWLATAKFLRGWALTWQGHFDQGFADMQTSIDLFRSTGAELGAAYFAGLLAETFGRSGQPDAGLLLMEGAFALIESTGDRWCEAELYRLQGELHLQLQAPAEAEVSFQKACSVAQAQHARLWELRAAVSLGQLWQNQGKTAEVHALIAPLYAWFQEGFALPDLLAAQRLLVD